MSSPPLLLLLLLSFFILLLLTTTQCTTFFSSPFCIIHLTTSSLLLPCICCFLSVCRPRITKIYFKGKYFMLRVRDKNVSKTYTYPNGSLLKTFGFFCRMTTVRMDSRLLLDKPVSIYGNVVWNITLSSDSFKYELCNFSLFVLL